MMCDVFDVYLTHNYKLSLTKGQWLIHQSITCEILQLTFCIAKCASNNGFKTLDQSTPSIFKCSPWICCCCDPLLLPLLLAPLPTPLGRGGRSTALAIACGSLTDTALFNLDFMELMDGLGNVIIGVVGENMRGEIEEGGKNKRREHLVRTKTNKRLMFDVDARPCLHYRFAP